jgi:hypothetical protein
VCSDVYQSDMCVVLCIRLILCVVLCTSLIWVLCFSVSGHSGALEGLTRVNQITDPAAAAAAGAAAGAAGGNSSGPKQREASHEYD